MTGLGMGCAEALFFTYPLYRIYFILGKVSIM